jgi:hypothetical protein
VALGVATFAVGRSDAEDLSRLRIIYFYEKSDKTEATEKLLEEVKKKKSIVWVRKSIEDFGEDRLKRDLLDSLAVWGEIQIPQSKKSKALYSHLVVFRGDKPFTFYPQRRHSKKTGDEVVSVEEFLKALLDERFRHIHNAQKLEKLWRDSESLPTWPKLVDK